MDGKQEQVIVKTDCRDNIGVTVSLIDAIISLCRIIRHRDLTSFEVNEARKDLTSDEDLLFLLLM